MSAVPYFLKNPALDPMQGMAAPPDLQPQSVDLPQLQRVEMQGAPVVPQKIAHALTVAEHLGGPVAAAPEPQTDALQPVMQHLQGRLQKDYQKDADPYGSPDNHPGIFGKIAHGLSVAAGYPNLRHEEEATLEGQLRDTKSEQSKNAYQGAQTAHTQQQTAAGEPIEITDEQANELESPELSGVKVAPSVLATLYKQRGINAQKSDASQDRMQQQLRTHGYALEGDGAIRPLKYEEMSPEQQSVTDLKNSQQSLADAKTEVARASNDPNSAAYKLALQKLEIAKQGHDAAQTRANAMMINAYGGNYGTDLRGNALPGAMTNDEGKPIGAHFSANVRPTGQERNKADMAASADQQIGDMQKIVAKRPDIFGPASGRLTDFNVWIGSQDPDAQRFRAARTIAGDHLAGTFGGRSEAALNALDSAIGHFKDNPEAVQAGLDQLKEANHLFLQRGTVHSVGGSNSEPSGNKSGGASSQEGSMIRARDPQGILHEAPKGTPLPKGWKAE